MKKIISFILTIFLLFVCFAPSYAWGTKNKINNNQRSGTEAYFEDFSSHTPGEAPNGFDVVNYGGKVYIEQCDAGEGEVKNALVLYDNMNPSAQDWGGPSTTKTITPVKGTVSFEFRFKVVKTNSDISPVSFNIKNGNDSACTIAVDASNGILSYTYGPSLSVELAGTNRWFDNEWVTVRVTLNLKEQQAGVEVWADCLINSDVKFVPSAKYEPSKGKLTYGNLTLNSSFAHNSINELKIAMSRYEGKAYVDYISVYKNAEMPQGNKNISAVVPVLESIENVPSGKYVNMLYNGKYQYFSAKTLNVNSSVYCSAEDIKEIFNISYEFEKDDMIFNFSKNVTVPSSKIKESFGIKFVPIRFLLENAGYSIGWVENTSTITVEER